MAVAEHSVNSHCSIDAPSDDNHPDPAVSEESMVGENTEVDKSTAPVADTGTKPKVATLEAEEV